MAYERAYAKLDTMTQGVYDRMLAEYKKDYDTFIKLTGDKETAMALYAQDMAAINEKMYGSDTWDMDAGSMADGMVDATQAYMDLYYQFGVLTREAYDAIAKTYADDRDAFIMATGDKKTAMEVYYQRMQDLTKELKDVQDDTYDLDYGSVTDGLDEIEKKGESTADSLNDAFSGWATRFSSTLTDMAWGADVSFQEIVVSFGKMLTQMAIQESMSDIGKWFNNSESKSKSGSGGFLEIIGSAFGSMFSASAKGSVFSGAGISSYENQIVSKPTIFPFARGIGLMGEAGDEAILPLTRTRSGNLGVEATGSQPSQNVYHITINAVDSKSFSDMLKKNQGAVVNIIDGAMKSNSSLRSTMGRTLA